MFVQSYLLLVPIALAMNEVVHTPTSLKEDDSDNNFVQEVVASKRNISFGCDDENVNPLENIKARCKALGVDVDAHSIECSIDDPIAHVRGSTKAQKNTLEDKLP